MDWLASIFDRIYRVVATVYGAGILGGVLILIAERMSRRAEPSDADVKRTAERYRQWYGDRASSVIGDHMLAARFAPDGRHSRFLKRVVAELQTQAGSREGRRRGGPPSTDV